MAMVQGADININGLAVALHAADVNSVVVMDVGQGSGNKIRDGHDALLYYFDVGCGALFNARTAPADAALNYDFTNQEPIILSHWDFDHWWAGYYKSNQDGRNCHWLAPRQHVSPIHQRVAATLGGNLHLWPADPAQTHIPNVNWADSAELNGPDTRLHFKHADGNYTNDRNGSGIGLIIERWVGYNNSRLCYLPGDAPFQGLDLANLNFRYNPQNHAVVATHHGSATNLAPLHIPAAQTAHATIVYSYGPRNGYHHPRAGAVLDYHARGWDGAAGVNLTETATAMNAGTVVPNGGVANHAGDQLINMLAGIALPAAAPPPPAAPNTGVIGWVLGGIGTGINFTAHVVDYAVDNPITNYITNATVGHTYGQIKTNIYNWWNRLDDQDDQD